MGDALTADVDVEAEVRTATLDTVLAKEELAPKLVRQVRDAWTSLNDNLRDPSLTVLQAGVRGGVIFVVVKLSCTIFLTDTFLVNERRIMGVMDKEG